MADPAEAAPSGAAPTLAEASGWIGFELDEAGGGRAGRVHSVFVDTEEGEPSWIVVALRKRGLLRGRRPAGMIAVPILNCAGIAGRVWTAHERGSLGAAPTVDPARPLLREHELAICGHYGMGEGVGRAAEVAGRPQGSVTSRPA